VDCKALYTQRAVVRHMRSVRVERCLLNFRSDVSWEILNFRSDVPGDLPRGAE